jgi:Predicted nucleoside-diphosphate sugar epimerases
MRTVLFIEKKFKDVANILLPAWVVFNIDLFLSFLSILIAYTLRYNFIFPDEVSNNFSVAILRYLLIRGVVFLIFGIAQTHIRYTNSRELIRLLFAVLTGTILLSMVSFIRHMLGLSVYLSFSVLIIDFFVVIYLLAGFRILARYIVYRIKTGNKNIDFNVVIFGHDHFAVSIKTAIETDIENPKKIIGFIHNTPKIYRQRIEGVSIFNLEELDKLKESYAVRELIITDSLITAEAKNYLIEKCLNLNIKILNLRNHKELLNNDSNTPQLNEIKIEDLLQREPINLSIKNIAHSLKGKNILITGAAGSIGSEIARQVFNFSPGKLILLDQAETPIYFVELEMLAKYKSMDSNVEVIVGDITDSIRMNKLFEQTPIDIIFHAAAYKHVPLMESNPKEAVKNNVFGTKILADLAVAYNVEKFVMISTDKAVNPTNIMGATKRIAEIYTQSLNGQARTQFITTRFGNVLGSNGSVIPLFKQQIEKGGPVTVTHPEVTRFFMTIPEACQLVLEASVMGHGGEIFIFDMGKSVKIVDLAKNMIRLAGYQEGKDIEIHFTGLRPGEKLYEELLMNGENTLPTYHKKIMKASVVKMDYTTITSHLELLWNILQTDKNQLSLVTKMKEIVPEYISQNSPYCKLDIQVKEEIIKQQ